MQSGAGTILSWVIVAVLVVGIWRGYRALRKSFRAMSQQRAEAFSNAVSEAVASGVAQALSAAVADATALATGGNVSVHIGDNLRRLIADNDYGSYDDNHRSSVLRSGGRSNVGGVQDSARRGELEGGRAIRHGDIDRSRSGDIRESPVPRGELA